MSISTNNLIGYMGPSNPSYLDGVLEGAASGVGQVPSVEDAYDAAKKNSYDGLEITDRFGDLLRDIQRQAAERQMEYQTNSAERAMQFSADEAQKARDWSEYMSSSQYARAVKDLKNAGLNPVLAAGGGISSGSFSSSTSATGIAQSGSQAQVSEYNSGLAAFEVYLETAASVVNSISNVFGVDVNKLVAGLGNGKATKFGFGK